MGSTAYVREMSTPPTFLRMALRYILPLASSCRIVPLKFWSLGQKCKVSDIYQVAAPCSGLAFCSARFTLSGVTLMWPWGSESVTVCVHAGVNVLPAATGPVTSTACISTASITSTSVSHFTFVTVVVACTHIAAVVAEPS